MHRSLPKPAKDVPAHLDKLFEKTKGQLFFKKGSGFLGSLLAQVNFVWTRDRDTAAISPDTLYWNPEFFESLDEKTRVTVLAHELWHLALAHNMRMGDRDHKIWNYAGDYVINNLLKKHEFYMDGFPYLLDPRFEDEKEWSTDDIYDVLVVEMPPSPAGGGEDEGDGEGGGHINGDDIMSTDDPDAVAEAMQKVMTAASIAGITCQPGVVPGEVADIIDRFLNPKLPWYTILFNYFNAQIEEVYSYARPNRRYDDPLLPGLVGREGLENLMYAADISGSITDEQIKIFFSEGKFIHDELGPEKMTFVTFDTQVHDIFEIEKEDDYSTFEITGRGGTDLEDLYREAKERAATCLVIFTDLYVDIPPNPPCDVIWIVFDNPGAEVPYGQKHSYETETWC